MQNKVVQSLVCELLVVATSVANEGIGATPGKHLLVRDDAPGIAEAVIELPHDAAARER